MDYDERGNVYRDEVFSVDPISGVVGTEAVTNYFYDGRGDVIATEAASGLWTKDIYDGSDRLSVEYQTDGAGGTGYAAASSVSGDHVLAQTQYLYDGDSNLIETIEADRLATDSPTATGALGDASGTGGPAARVSYAASYYDAADRDIADVNAGTNGGAVWTRPLAAPASSSSLLVTGYTYDAAGNLATMTDPLGLVTAYSYDALGRTTKTIADDTGSFPTDSTNQTTIYSYDGDDNLISETAVMPAGEASQTTSYIYGVSPATGSAIYDNDLLYETVYPDPASGGSAAGWTYTGYAGVTGNDSAFTGGDPDAPQGNQAAFLQGNGSVSQQLTFAAGTYSLSFDAVQRVDNGNNNQQVQVLIDGQVVGTFTPGNGSYGFYSTVAFAVSAGVHTITLQGVNTSGDNTAFVDNVQLHAVGSGTAPALIDPGFEDSSVGSGGGAYTYDPVVATSADTETYSYDSLGDQIGYTDRNGTTHSYSYDALDRLTSDTVTAFGTGVAQSVAQLGWAYTDDGELSTATSYNSAGGVVNQDLYTYDGLGNVAREYQSSSGAVNTSSTPHVDYTYDQSTDRLTSITYPNGRTLTYNYNADIDASISRLSSSISDSSGTLQSYSYQGLDTPLDMTDGNGVTENTTLDNFSRVATLAYSNTGGTIDSFTYGYDQDGNVLSKRNNVLSGQSELYSYDGLNRLQTFSRGTLNGVGTAISGGSASQGWTLDSLGNWNSSTDNGMTTSRTNDAQNQATVVGGNTLSYDANGNLLTYPDGMHYVYDAWNRLVKATYGGGTLAAYMYDASGRRVTQTGGGTTTTLYYSLASTGQVIEERQGGTTTMQYVWSPFYVNQMIERDDQPSGGSLTRRIYVEQDVNYNVTSLTDASGNVLERVVYSPYGTATLESASGSAMSSNPYNWSYSFQGGRIDLATGLIHFGAREYSTVLGRWLQQDPAGYVNGLNDVQFELSNSVNLSDPAGLTVLAPGVPWAPPSSPPAPTPIPTPVPQGGGGGTGTGSGGMPDPAALVDWGENMDRSLYQKFPWYKRSADWANDKKDNAGRWLDRAMTPKNPLLFMTRNRPLDLTRIPDGQRAPEPGGQITIHPQATTKPSPPQKATDAADHANKNGGGPQPGYKGGDEFKNREGRLPKVDGNGKRITYKEYDFNPYTPGVNRGNERVVIGSDGSQYYTDDHYGTFRKF